MDASDAKQRMEALPREQDFEELGMQLAYAIWAWKVWKQLYDRRDKPVLGNWTQVQLMIDMAPRFFELVSESLREWVQLQICKLTEEHQFRDHVDRRNLSVRLYIELNPHGVAQKEVAEAKRLYADIEPLLAILRKRRDKTIAHWDLLTMQGASPLQPVIDLDIDRVVEALAGIMHAMRFDDAEVMYNDMLAHGDGESVIHALCYARRYRDQCLKDGRWPLGIDP